MSSFETPCSGFVTIDPETNQSCAGFRQCHGSGVRGASKDGVPLELRCTPVGDSTLQHWSPPEFIDRCEGGGADLEWQLRSLPTATMIAVRSFVAHGDDDSRSFFWRPALFFVSEKGRLWSHCRRDARECISYRVGPNIGPT